MIHEYEGLKLTIEDGAATIQIARPEKRNAMSPALHRGMNLALDAIEAAGGVKVAVLTGTDEVFCGGMDLEKYFLEPFDRPREFRANLAASHGWMRRWKAFAPVTVASINGLCIGGGLLMASLCDIAIAAEEAVFGLSEVNFGIFPAGGTTWAVAQNMTRKHALYYSLTADRFDGRRAAEIGLVSVAVPREHLAAETARVVATLRQKSLDALHYTKRVYERSRTMSFPEAQEWEVAMLLDLSYTTENAWIRDALEKFRRREYRPAESSYLTRPEGENDDR
ncbi:enoyl-CoA hydratase-related protein [Nannocystis radixulma]|uniref:Enoyl-CoA hydratase-related protein n=1 Tax=Nannocystis radixulma TaxID=2995305 RepID=A0ABT5AWR5_9BACT|nr:enoyl-CoA hydratase-related protein [Nannocystis radixulma]MDC0666275.1 enoyl-CoA hydratase-related protein [Nannocystis radixulma]